MWAKHKNGFTIVELLIVIVVIGILAAISLVAFNSVQTRASNVQTIDAVKQFVKAYSLYATDNGDYPALTGCLGEGYPGPNNYCLSQSGTAACWSTGAATSTAINNALKPYMNDKVPSPSMQRATCGTTSYVGAYASYISASKTVVIYMILRGDQTCPPMSPNSSAPSKAFQDDATRCYYLLQAVS
jgi:prepilin-type N-terminal cleavage/methylation domain-containing protein